jgi:hypothetical protein
MRWSLVQVLWLDSADPNDSWVRASDWSEVGQLDCVSVGWLIGEDSEAVVLASHISDPEEEVPRANGIMAIPKRAILGARRLKTTTAADPASKRVSLRASFGVPAFGEISEPFADAFLSSPRGKRPFRRGVHRRHARVSR